MSLPKNSLDIINSTLPYVHVDPDSSAFEEFKRGLALQKKLRTSSQSAKLVSESLSVILT